jgi:outer membrane protein assembly factor BamB
MAPEILWKTRIPGVTSAHPPDHSGRPNPVAAGDMLFASIFSPGEVVALDVRTGQIHWRQPIGRPLPHRSCGSSCPTGGLAGGHVLPVGDAVYARTAQTLYCLDAASGSERWRFCPYGEDQEWIYSSPEVAGGRVFIGDRKGWLHCLEADSGRPIWQVMTSEADNNQVNATPLAEGAFVYVTTNAGLLIAYEQATGQVCWRASLDEPCLNRPFLALQGIVAYTSGTAALFDIRDGRRLMRTWNLRGRHEISNACGTGNSAFFLLRHPNRWVRIDGHGKTVVEGRAPDYPRSIRHDPRSHLLYVTAFSEIDVLDPDKGALLDRIESGEMLSSNPDVTSGTLLFLGGRGTVSAVKLLDSLAGQA